MNTPATKDVVALSKAEHGVDVVFGKPYRVLKCGTTSHMLRCLDAIFNIEKTGGLKRLSPFPSDPPGIVSVVEKAPAFRLVISFEPEPGTTIQLEGDVAALDFGRNNFWGSARLEFLEVKMGDGKIIECDERISAKLEFNKDNPSDGTGHVTFYTDKMTWPRRFPALHQGRPDTLTR